MKKYSLLLIITSFFFAQTALAVKANLSLSKFIVVGGADNGQKACPMGPAGTYLISDPKSVCGFSWVSFVPTSTATMTYAVQEIGTVNTTTTMETSPLTQGTADAAVILSGTAVAIALKKKKVTPPKITP